VGAKRSGGERYVVPVSKRQGGLADLMDHAVGQRVWYCVAMLCKLTNESNSESIGLK